VQGVTVFEALQMYTVMAAGASSEFAYKGSIEQGELADFTVLSNNPAFTSVSQIGGVSVCFTLVGGVVVYSKT
jgi:predicted amidohydrolase YtcJ